MPRVSFPVSAALLVLLLSGTGVSAQPARIEVGVLTCSVAGGQGFIVGSTRSLDCVFKPPGGDEHYRGTITRRGIAIGVIEPSTIAARTAHVGEQTAIGCELDGARFAG